MFFAYLAAIAYSCLVGFSFMFVKTGLSAASSWDLLAWRYIAALAVCFPVILSGRVKIALRPGDFKSILPLALFYPTMFFSFQTVGLSLIPSSEAGIITATVPIFALILAALILREKATAPQALFVFFSVAGVVFISFMKGSGSGDASQWGVFLILASTFSQAMYNVLARRSLKRFSVFDLTFGMTVMAFAAFVSIALGIRVVDAASGNAPDIFGGFFAPLANRDFLLAVLYLGPLSSLCTSLLANYALARIEAFRMSVFNNLATVVSMLAGFFIMRENLEWYHCVGATVIIIGVIGTSYFGRKTPPRDDG